MKRSFALCLSVLFLTITALPQAELSKADQNLIKDFEKRARSYVKLREKARKGIPVNSKDATPEDIERYKDSLQANIQAARSKAKAGDMFPPAAQTLFRRIIKNEFPGFEASELRKQVLEADTKGVLLRINFPYPEDKELVQMPPPLLLALPQLPKDLRYRFVGRALVLMDRDASIIVDIMRDAMP